MMRITTAQSFDAGITQLQQRQRDLTDAQERLTTGKRVARASDDPAAAARAERALASMARSDASQRALEASRSAMTLTEGALADAGELMQQARETLVAAGNATYSDAERQGLASQLAGIRQQLLSVANRGDGAGGFVFAGQGASQPPFVDTTGGVQFRGVAGSTQVASEEPLPRTIDGQAAWLASPNGNGLFTTSSTSAAPGSAGAWIDAGRVTDPQTFFAATSPPVVANPATLQYDVQFTATAAGATFSVLKNGAATGLTNVPFVSGQAIGIDGMSFTITGTPSAGDSFQIRPSTASLSVFDTLDRAIAELKTPLRSSAAVTQGVQSALTSLDGSMGALQSLRSQVGQTLNRTDMVESHITAQKGVAQTERSNAEDLDMVKAISDFQSQQTGYDAALKSYASVQRMSLLQYLNP